MTAHRTSAGLLRTTRDRWPALLPVVPEWTASANCAGADPDVWYPEKGGGDSPWAKRICMACEVRTECLDAALERAEQWGIWGGMTRHERRAERRRRGMAPPRPELGEVSDDGGEAA